VQYVTNDETVITWEEASASVQDYRIKYCKKVVDSLSPNFDPQEVSEVFVTGLSATVTGLEPDSAYEFEISAKQSFDESFTEASSALIHTLPNPVARLRLIKSNLDWIKVAWEKPATPVEKFEVIVFDDTGRNMIKKMNVSPVKSATKVEELSPAKWYQVQVRSISNLLLSPKRIAMVHTELNQPTGITIVNITEISAIIQWEPPAERCKTIVTVLNLHNNTGRKVQSLKSVCRGCYNMLAIFRIDARNGGLLTIICIFGENFCFVFF